MYTIPHPNGEHHGPHIVTVPLYSSHPLVMIQDSKHALKTLRNNAFSGAWLLVLGSYTVTYKHLHRLAFDDIKTPPLYCRDVEKLDRQDDNAASRLFLHRTLEYHVCRYPINNGETVYLFVFGELVDAYQSCHLAHITRVIMVLQAHFFMDIWTRFLDRAGYLHARFCISREAIDIIRILINGFLGLLIVHRNHCHPGPVPFYPWKHLTEVCKHLSGLMRKIVQDFTYLDFLYMVPDLHAMLANISEGHGKDTRTSRPATGYSHTWTDQRGIDVVNLSTYPTDSDINAAARIALDEACNLWFAVGVSSEDVEDDDTHIPRPPLPKKRPSSRSVPVPNDPLDPSVPKLPSIAAWFLDSLSSSSEDDSDDDNDIKGIVREQERLAPIHDERLVEVKLALVSLAVDTRMRLFVFSYT
jgi:hypothetical protein